MTKGIVLAACLVAATIAPAAAADPDWKGFYVGAQAGYGSSAPEWTDIDYDWFGGTLSNKDEGFSYGVTVGYNFGNGPMVYGLEADYTFGFGENDVRYSDDVDLSDDYKSLITLRARAGVVAGNALLYVTAGVAQPDFEHTWIEDFDPEDSWQTFESSKLGLVYGAGVEHRIGKRFSLKGEFIVAKSAEDSAVNPDGYEMRVSENISTLRLGLNWHF